MERALRERSRRQCSKDRVVPVPLPVPLPLVSRTRTRTWDRLEQCAVATGSSRLLPSVTECSICLETMNGDDEVTRLTPCHHQFHTECVRTWLKEKRDCPLCRNFAMLHDEFPALA